MSNSSNNKLGFSLAKFFHSSIAGGVILISCTVIAIVLSQVPVVGSWYASIWETPIIIGIGDFVINHTFKEWINDALMSIFFFAIGLEIKREMLVGHLSTIKQASLPVFAAIGGMVVPALIYMLFNHSNDTTFSGWGIPMATDIAFALGILSMFSKKIPISLKIFLTALAVVDDLGAILVIAIFYSSSIQFTMLILAGILLLMLFIMNRLNVLQMQWYFIPAIIVWLAFLNSGIHATISGVLIALAIPMRAKYKKNYFMATSKEYLSDFSETNKVTVPLLCNDNQYQYIKMLRKLTKDTISPIQRYEKALHPIIAFAIMPLFALANAGVIINIIDLPQLISSQGLGIQLGLVVGKPLGIMLFSWFIIRLGVAAKPEGATWKTITGVACLGGIGFTMSIFIDMLAFPVDSPEINYGKMAILSASIIAMIVGSIILASSKVIDKKYHW